MDLQQSYRKEPFIIRPDKIAMVSLGPLQNKDCPYNCAYCYIHSSWYAPYTSMPVDGVVEWLRTQSSELFDIVYISGDTDSFAPPRTDQALSLLNKLTELDTDLLFTTKYVFSKEQMEQLGKILQKMQDKSRKLFGCVTIAQLHNQYLEPKPIPDPEKRLNQLGKFKEMGLVSVLAMRPFLPTVPVDEYVEIVDKAHTKVDVILGEVWYADPEGILENRVFKGTTHNQISFSTHQMDFDGQNPALWRVFEGSEIKTAISAKCEALGIPFFMRSRPAIEHIRKLSV